MRVISNTTSKYIVLRLYFIYATRKHIIISREAHSIVIREDDIIAVDFGMRPSVAAALVAIISRLLLYLNVTPCISGDRLAGDEGNG